MVLTGTFATAAAVQSAIESGGTRQLTFNTGTAANDDIVILYSDGVNSYFAAVNIGSAATTITAGASTVTSMVELTGITSIATGDFLAANFAVVA
jgi:hypothetical protein